MGLVPREDSKLLFSELIYLLLLTRVILNTNKNTNKSVFSIVRLLLT